MTRYARFVLGFPGFLRQRITLEQARRIVGRRMAQREESFLRLVRTCLFGPGRNPYRELFRLSGYGLEDVEKHLLSDGLDATLSTLHEAGIFIAFDEFKGRRPIKRHGRVIHVEPEDFDNPVIRKSFVGKTSGTTGRRTRAPIDLGYLLEEVPIKLLFFDAFGLLNVPIVLWREVPPAIAGIKGVIRSSVTDNIPLKWFAPIVGKQAGQPFRRHLLTLSVVGLGRLMGRELPWPEPADLCRPDPVVDWLEKTMGRGNRCVVSTQVSMAIRICVAAFEKGLDLSGVTFWGGGELPTRARVAQIVKTGARWISNYATTETGTIAVACANPNDDNDLHVVKDHAAIIQKPTELNRMSKSINALYITDLLQNNPKLMINIESDDCGTIERRSCGCPLEAYGYTDHLLNIRSVHRSAGEHLTLLDDGLMRVVEEVLPERFGGTLLDYQLVEECFDPSRLFLYIHPRIRLEDEKAVLRLMEVELKKSPFFREFNKTIGSNDSMLTIRREEPVITPGSKFMPFHVVKGTF